ncbi:MULTISPECIES: hypothetical protein [unclassified Methylobacterium]|uniref:hypothetical protein n=1 Tax=unclassified Methylobacterium TaxID=2615210 RepID=UPI00226A2489|nr:MULTISPECIES: hypothetical protein [unclassified Methylobacterium]
MPRRPAQSTQADFARAIRAMRAAGYPDVRAVFNDGTVIVEPAPKDTSARQGDRPLWESEEIAIL